LAKAFAGLDRKEEAEEALQHYKSLGGTGLDKVRAEMLSGEMRQLKEQLRSQRQSEMMASLGQLVGGMAHEFFSPLAAIQTQIDFINRYLLADHANEGELRSSLEEIKCQKGKMAEIVDHLRELARGDKLQSSLVDVAVIARKALSLYETQFISNGIELQLDINDRLPPIMANPLRIEQMFINLLLNAKDSLVEISQGSRLINISVRLITSYSQDSIEIRVNDTGAGVPDNFRDKVFDPFFTTKEPGRGLGLGLSLVKGTVTDYGGSIYIDGPATSGAAFVVLFPVQQEAIA
jgi:histidine kinase